MCQCVKKLAAKASEGGHIFMPPPPFSAQAAFVVRRQPLSTAQGPRPVGIFWRRARKTGSFSRGPLISKFFGKYEPHILINFILIKKCVYHRPDR